MTTPEKVTFEPEKLQSVLNNVVDNKLVFGAVMTVDNITDNWTGAAGNLSPEQPYFIASTTKLYITAIILKLRADKKLTLDDKITTYLEPAITEQLHVYKSTDYSKAINI